MSEARVQLDVVDRVATVRMVRAERHNALDGAMFTALAGVGKQVADDPSVRAVVLLGEGKSFCSGLDVASFASGEGLGMDDLMGRPDGQDANLAQRVALQWQDLPVPVIAAVHGNCLGGGLQIALGADVRIAAPDARLAVLEVKWGLVPDMGITRSLLGLVRPDVARELTYTGRMLSGTEAAALGLVTSTAEDPVAAAQELAAAVAARSPDAVRAAKRLYAEAPALDPRAALALETELQVGLLGSHNQIAAVTAGMTGEPGDYHDPA